MSGHREQIDQLLAEVEREAYERGYRDAIAAVTKAALSASPVGNAPESAANGNAEPVEMPRQRGRPAKAIAMVHDMIIAKPGMTGVEIVKALEAQGTPVLERTARSCLRRLRESKAIWQRKRKWYPRPKDKDESSDATESPRQNGLLGVSVHSP